MNVQTKEWDMSYRNRDNFLFYPNEEVIRFVSKYIRKRIGFGEFQNCISCNSSPTIIDLGCGIGRHVIYCHEMGLDAYGIDLSGDAVRIAVKWAGDRGMARPENNILQGDIRHLPWEREKFDFAISHGVLDSMHFDVARSMYRINTRSKIRGNVLL